MIEIIRGVSCDHAVNKLVEYNLVKELGRLDAPGRPLLFGTTEEFLRSFGVQSLDELPMLDQVLIEEFKQVPGLAPGVDLEQDIVKVAVFERHRGTSHVGLGFLGNYGLKRGAVATSVGHDSHNLVVAGVCDEDMIVAGNRVLENEGGLAIAVDGVVVGELPLTVAGLMSDLPAEKADWKLEEMKAKLGELGIQDGIDGFMTLAFVSLPVIPAIRVNTLGVVDVGRQEIVDAVIE